MPKKHLKKDQEYIKIVENDESFDSLIRVGLSPIGNGPKIIIMDQEEILGE